MMKRFTFLLLFVASITMGAWAQKGMMGVGAHFGLHFGESVAAGGGVTFQYNLTDRLRLQPEISGYGVDRIGINGIVLANINWFFVSPRPLRPYLFFGLGYVNWEEETEYYNGYYNYYYTDVYDGIGVNAGIGLDWRLSHRLSLQAEFGGLGGFSGDDDLAVARFSLGLTYNF